MIVNNAGRYSCALSLVQLLLVGCAAEDGAAVDAVGDSIRDEITPTDHAEDNGVGIHEGDGREDKNVIFGSARQALTLGVIPANFGACTKKSPAGSPRYDQPHDGACSMPDRLPVRVRKSIETVAIGSELLIPAIDNALNAIFDESEVYFVSVTSGEDVLFRVVQHAYSICSADETGSFPGACHKRGTLVSHTPAPNGTRGTASTPSQIILGANDLAAELNTRGYYTGCTASDAGTRYAQYVVVHELGHHLGFGHDSYGGGSSAMKPVTLWMQTDPPQPSPGGCTQPWLQTVNPGATRLGTRIAGILNTYIANNDALLPE